MSLLGSYKLLSKLRRNDVQYKVELQSFNILIRTTYFREQFCRLRSLKQRCFDRLAQVSALALCHSHSHLIACSFILITSGLDENSAKAFLIWLWAVSNKVRGVLKFLYAKNSKKVKKQNENKGNNNVANTIHTSRAHWRAWRQTFLLSNIFVDIM